ncbi:MAG: M14 family zinc carboxypeptidase [Planctomycetota bacterium]
MSSTLLLLPLLSAPAPLAAPQEALGERVHLRFGDPVELAYDEPFFPGASYDPALPTADAILGQQLGTRLSHHDEILECFRAWSEASPRMTSATYARSHEGRELIYAVVTSPANHARLDDILADHARLHDPRGLSEADGSALATQTPPVAWMGYSIHGDELSGCDAALALGYHLVASTDEEVERLLDELVIVIDPCMNPDGRMRIVSMVEQSAGYTPNLDYASMHRGHWPWGRGNHYLFDMNRDWIAGSQPETRGRWRTALRFHPQLFVDAHEMGMLDTFLFYPQAEPLNKELPPKHAFWHGEFAADLAQTFDANGWGYYTREWADGWGPFYSDAWASLTGAIGILYEQSSNSGFPLRRASGEVMTFREAVHHQTAASITNLRTLAARDDQVMTDYLAAKRRNVAADTPGNDRMFVLVPGDNRSRERELLGVLLGQGIECFTASEAFTATAVEDRLGRRTAERELPDGSILIPARQPMRALVQAFLAHDPRMSKEALQAEREELEQTGWTKIYDLTAWSLPHAFDLDTLWCDAADVAREPLRELPQPPTPRVVRGEQYAWVVDAADDAALVFAVRAMELGLKLHASDREFTAAGRSFPRGSLLIRRHENEGTPGEVRALVERAAQAAGVLAFATGTGRSPDEGPDLGGGHFHLLSRPRVAMLANAPVAPDTYGHLWHHLDARLGVPFTLLDAHAGGGDLRRYNVLILPPGSSSYVDEHAESLTTWVEGGGTLIAIGDAAAAAGGAGLSSVELRRDALDRLGEYRTVVERERAADAIEIDEAAVWGDPVPEASEPEDEQNDEAKDAEEPGEVDADHDGWMRTFAPYGVTLLGEVSPRHWLTAGTGEHTPVYFSGSRVFLARPPVQTAVRLAPADELRLGGLVWPEARERIADSAWLTAEGHGAGQVILFAAMPAYRGYHAASARLFANAVVLGPGLGASQPLGW